MRRTFGYVPTDVEAISLETQMFLSHPLEGALTKLRRADFHLADLVRQVTAFVDAKPYGIKVVSEPTPGRFEIRSSVTAQIPLELSTVAGDAIHNLRSVLDHLIWELSLLNYQSQHSLVTRPDRAVQFPIYAEVPSETLFRRRVKSLPAAAIEIVRALQPYVATPANPKTSPLWLLNDLDVWDKHKRIPLALATHGDLQVDVRMKSGRVVRTVIPAIGKDAGYNYPIEDGRRLAGFSFPPKRGGLLFDPDREIDVAHVVTPIDISFGHETAARYMPIVSVMERCRGAVGRVLDSLSGFFPPLPETSDR